VKESREKEEKHGNPNSDIDAKLEQWLPRRMKLSPLRLKCAKEISVCLWVCVFMDACAIHLPMSDYLVLSV